MSLPPGGDPLHEPSPPGRTWVSTNIAEALPGVPTPLSWTFWREPLNRSGWFTYVALGATTWAERAATEADGERLIGIAAGRPVANVDLMRRLVNRVPGLDADALCEQVFDIPRPDPPTPRSRRRWPVVAVRAPVALATLSRRLRRAVADADRFWRANTAGPPSRPRRLLDDAHGRFSDLLSLHVLEGALAQGAYDGVVQLAERSSWSGAAGDLVTGYGRLPETELAHDLWRLARHELDADEVLAHHGYHAPDAGELSTASWREDPASLWALAEPLGAGDDPGAQVERQGEAREQAERALLAGLAPGVRPMARARLRAARWLIPLREVGKSGFLRLLDVARHAARGVGADLVEQGLLAEPDDVFFLTIDEVHAPPPGCRALVDRRRASREAHLAHALPAVYSGEPTPLPLVATGEGGPPVATAAGTVVRGQPVCPGVVEATARVVRSAAECDAPLGGDEVLVAHVTDPSWVGLFMGAAALVVDVGGPMSHAAIVARELGIPCVVGTGDGTERIAPGSRVRVDGTAGTVEAR